ncbi:uncharacterized protein [Aristolochia californica]|uniref:uncharacterized protein n=1 Tax=Aristolochia californica TaxID=171875 RepID=UPI0035E07770
MASVVGFFCRYNGKLKERSGYFDSYDGGESQMKRIAVSTKFSEFLVMMYRFTGWDADTHQMFIKAKIPFSDGVFVISKVENDNDLIELFEMASSNRSMVEIFLEKVLRQRAHGREGTRNRNFIGETSCPQEQELPRTQEFNTQGREVGFLNPSSIASLSECGTSSPLVVNDDDSDSFSDYDIGSEDSEGDGDEIFEAGVHRNRVETTDSIGYPDIYEDAWEVNTRCIKDDSRIINVLDSTSNNISVGQIFEDKSQMVDFLKKYSIERHVKYKTLRSSSCDYKIECGEDGCPWSVFASCDQRIRQFKIRKYGGDHTCVNSIIREDNPVCTSSFICQVIMPTVRTNFTLSPNDIQQIMKDKYHISVRYAKAWRAKCKAIKAIYGDWDESYNLLPRFLDAIKEANPANEFILCSEEFGHERMFKCVFWAFGPSIAGFQYCRPLISVDGTHLYGKYPHCLLIATTLDGNNGLFPLAFAIVESENQKSWEWFLACLDRFVIKGKKPFTLISDRQKGLLMAVQKIFLPSECFHRFCVHHLVANFKKTFKNDTLNALIWSAARKTNIIEFDRTMELIEQQSERAKELLTEGPLRPEFWSLAHDGNVRFGVLTTNMSESFNNVLRGARRLPIQALVAATFHRLNKYFVERHEFARKMTSFCTPSVDVSLKNKRDKARACRVQQYTNNMYEISMDDGRLYQVDLVNMTCTCNHFQMEQIPCTHAIAVCAKINYDFNQLCSRWYTTEAYRGTYAIGFYPHKDKLYWPNTGVRVVPPIARKQPGRPRSVRIRTEMDKGERGTYFCGTCKQSGHNSRKCRNPPVNARPDKHSRK